MKLSRRDFIHAGCTIAVVSALAGPQAQAGINNPGSASGGGGGGGNGISQRNIVNVNFTFDAEYPFIVANRTQGSNPTLNGASPFDGFSLSPFPQLIDRDGYPNSPTASGQNIGGAASMPASSNFAGPWITTWDGDGRVAQQGSPVWTDANLFTAGTATISIANPAVVTFANSFVAGQIVVFTTTGALPTGLLINTPYYVLSSGLSGASFQISATKGGAAIVTTGSQSGTHTIQGTYTRNGNGDYTNFPGQKAYIISSNSGITTPTQQAYRISSSGGAPATVNGITWSGGLVTVTMAAVHNRPVGSSLKLTLAGTDNANLNGTFFSTITSTTQFTFALAGSGAVTVFGTMTAFVSNIQIYRQADEADLLAGNIFRSAWKQPLVNLNPGALRFMNWSGGNAGQAYSFLDRTLPNHANWNCSAASFVWSIGPAYGRTSGYNAWTLAAVSTGTPSNPNTTPGAMVHGEVAQFQINASGSMGRGPQVTITSIGIGVNPTVNATGHGLFAGDKIWFTVTAGMTQINGGNAVQTNRGAVTVASITDANNFVITLDTSAYSTFTAGFFTRSCDAIAVTAVSKAAAAVVTAANHGCSVGDVVVLDAVTTGMVLLNLFPVTVQSIIDKDNFTINVNTTGYPTWTSGTLKQYCTLNVGGRGAFPILFSFGSQVATFASAINYMNYGSYKAFRFDKTFVGKYDGAGNPIMGAWIYSPNSQGYSNDVPIEVCTACINELNAMSVAQGKNNPIHMYITTPPTGIDSTDTDQTTAKLYGRNMVDVIINGANGYAALTSKAHLFIEYSNELWNSNSGPNTYVRYRGFSRWPSVGTGDYGNMQMFRATAMAIDIANAFSCGNSGQRIHRVLGGPPNAGSAVGSFNNQLWATGSSTTAYSTDATVTGGSWGAPSTKHEMYVIASYVDNNSTYYNSATTGTRTFNDDLALYFGTDNSGKGGGNYTGVPNQALAIQNFVDSCVAQTSSGPGFAYYVSTHSDVSGWIGTGKFYAEYEGAFNWNTKSGTNNNAGQALTANGQTFMLAISNSSAWATAQTNYFNTIAAMANTAFGAIYTISSGSSTGDQRWSYAAPDSYASGTEGQALLNNPAWVAMSSRNQALLV